MEEKRNDVVAVELQAPVGWRKQFIPPKSGTPRRKDVLFISPTGDEIKSKRQLALYLKSHPGGPDLSEFNWGSGDTPRWSSRLTDKSKAEGSPESETPTKRQRKSSSKKVGKEKEDSNGDDEIVKEKEVSTEAGKGDVDVSMEDAQAVGEIGNVAMEAAADRDDVEYTFQNTEGGEVTEAALADEDNVKVSVDEAEDVFIDAPEFEEILDMAFDTEGKGSEAEAVETQVVVVNNKEAEKGADPKDSFQLPIPGDASLFDQGAESVKEDVTQVADAQAANKAALKELEAQAELPDLSFAPFAEEEMNFFADADPQTTDTNVKESKTAENVNDAVGQEEVKEPKMEESKKAEVGQEEHQNKDAPEVAAVRCM